MADAWPAASSRCPSRSRGRRWRARARLRPSAGPARGGLRRGRGIVVVMGVRAAGEVDPAESLVVAAAARARRRRAAGGCCWRAAGRCWRPGATTRRDISLWCRTAGAALRPRRDLGAGLARRDGRRAARSEKLAAVGGENVLALCAAVGLGGLGDGRCGISPWWLRARARARRAAVAAGGCAGRVAGDPRPRAHAAWNYCSVRRLRRPCVLVQLAVSGSVDVLASRARLRSPGRPGSSS